MEASSLIVSIALLIVLYFVMWIVCGQIAMDPVPVNSYGCTVLIIYVVISSYYSATVSWSSTHQPYVFILLSQRTRQYLK